MSAAPVIDLPHAPTYAANDSQIATPSVIAFPRRLRAYDMADQPRAISGSSTGTYQYDGNMKRVKSVVDGVTIYNIYDASGSLVHIDDLGTGNKTDYVKGAGLSLARIKKAGPVDITRYLHPDHLGSPVVGTNSLCISRDFNKDKPQEMGKQGPIPESFHTQITRGNLAWIERYTPFGEEINDHPVNDNQAGFTGQIKDSATGLSYMQARYYDPVIGRFLSIDAMDVMGSGGNPQYFNRYAYTFNDPVNNLDPDGNVVETVWDAANVALGAASTANNLKQGNYGAAAVDAVGTVIDAAATVVPFVPGGASTGIKLGRAGLNAADSAGDAKKKCHSWPTRGVSYGCWK